jgi:tetratricopeptide (TPR) repeat protein
VVRRHLFSALGLFASAWAVTLAAGQTPPAGTAPQPAKATDVKPKALSKEEEDGRAAFLRGDLEKCLEEFRKAGKANANLPPAKVMLANLFLESRTQNAGANARELIESAAAEDPRHPDIYLANGNYAFNEGRITEAILNLQTCLKLSEDPRFDAEQRARFVRESRTGLVFSFERRRDFTSVKEHLLALLQIDPKNAAFRARLAIANFNLGVPETAFDDLQAAFKDDPALNPPELQMGLLWAGRQDDAKAEEWFKKAVAAHPNDARVHRGYAGWLIDTGKFDAAKPYLESAEKISPTARDTQFLRGLLHRYLRQYGEAEKIFEVLVRDSAADVQAAGNLALVLSESDDPKKKKRGVDLAESVVKQNQQASEAFAVLSWCYYKSGRLPDAEGAIATAVRGGQANLDTVYYLAKILHDRGKIADAHRYLKEALAKKGPFVYRPEAQTLFAELEKKLPPPVKDEPKKP